MRDGDFDARILLLEKLPRVPFDVLENALIRPKVKGVSDESNVSDAELRRKSFHLPDVWKQVVSPCLPH